MIESRRRLIAVVGLAIILSGCTQTGELSGLGVGTGETVPTRPETATAADTKPDPPEAAAAGGTPPPAMCVAQVAECVSVEINGRTVWYAVLSALTETDRSIIVDYGGPGLDGTRVLASNGRLGLPQDMVEFNLIAVPDPLVSDQLSEECERAVTSFMSRLVGTTTKPTAATLESPSESVARSCLDGVHDVGPSALREGIREVLDSRGWDIAGGVGVSYGALRLSRLLESDSQAPKPLVVIDPIPLTTRGTDLIEIRLQALSQVVEAECSLTATCDELDGFTFSNLEVEQPIAVESRSVPIGLTDLGAALAMSAFLDADDRSRVFAALADVVEADHGDAWETSARQVATLADAANFRYGIDSYAPAIVSFWIGICTAADDWTGLPALLDSSDGVAAVWLAAFHMPCLHIGTGEFTSIESLLNGHLDMCVFKSTGDFVGGSQAAESWSRVATGGSRLFEAPRHGDLSTLEISECIGKEE